MVTLENRFFWLFLQAFYCKNEKQKHNFFFFNENYGNKGLNSFADACNTAGMKISTAKTEVLHLSRNPDQCVLQVNGATLKQVEKFKYLGVAFTSDGRQDEELDTRIGKAIVQ